MKAATEIHPSIGEIVQVGRELVVPITDRNLHIEAQDIVMINIGIGVEQDRDIEASRLYEKVLQETEFVLRK